MLMLSFSFSSNLGAEETTTEEITTEETTNLNEEDLAPFEARLFEDAKTWITAAITATLSWLVSGGIGYLILKKYERRALASVEQSVKNNDLSQKQADLAVSTIKETSNKMADSLGSFENKIDNKLQSIIDGSSEVSKKVDGINKFFSTFEEALRIYLIEDEE